MPKLGWCTGKLTVKPILILCFVFGAFCQIKKQNQCRSCSILTHAHSLVSGCLQSFSFTIRKRFLLWQGYVRLEAATWLFAFCPTSSPPPHPTSPPPQLPPSHLLPLPTEEQHFWLLPYLCLTAPNLPLPNFPRPTSMGFLPNLPPPPHPHPTCPPSPNFPPLAPRLGRGSLREFSSSRRHDFPAPTSAHLRLRRLESRGRPGRQGLRGAGGPRGAGRVRAAGPLHRGAFGGKRNFGTCRAGSGVRREAGGEWGGLLRGVGFLLAGFGEIGLSSSHFPVTCQEVKDLRFWSFGQVSGWTDRT